jgi:murein DD-endopeptidase MepM/ murein hydrolase activator NlpD
VRRIWVCCVLVATSLTGPGGYAEEIELIAPIDGPISRHFEPPPTPYAAGHRGIDYAAPVGTDVVACAPGVVAFAGPVGGVLAISIDHPGGLRTTYTYLGAVLVKKGAQVAQGQLIARSGPGHDPNDAPELHLGLRRGETYLDPEPVLIASMRRNLQRVIRLAA